MPLVLLVALVLYLVWLGVEAVWDHRHPPRPSCCPAFVLLDVHSLTCQIHPPTQTRLGITHRARGARR